MTSSSLFIVFSLALYTLSTLAQAQDAKGIKSRNLQGADLALMNNHDPASELENFELLPGYQANLFAADPMLANPVHMNWDSKGRLWVACSWTYPQIKPGDVADDKIIILEDTDNDGTADKSTVFADGLYLPTGIELANGGCYVGQSPDVFFLKDTDGDDVADIKELTLTGNLTNNGTLTLENNATIVQGASSTYAGSGTVQVKQTITGGNNGSSPSGRFWYLGSPVAGGLSSILDAAGANVVKYWDEPGAAWVEITDNTTALDVGRGHYLRSFTPGNQTLTFTGGALNNGTYTLPLTANGASFNGFNLVSNPYPS
ncbi:MAG: hypothetical protein QNL33_03295, partial [Akkermansiaceae bacterium]